MGLDDITGLKAASVLVDMWVLQHIKSDGSKYRPFVINIGIDVPISGTFTIPPGFEDIKIDIQRASQPGPRTLDLQASKRR